MATCIESFVFASLFDRSKRNLAMRLNKNPAMEKEQYLRKRELEAREIVVFRKIAFDTTLPYNEHQQKREDLFDDAALVF